MSPSLKDCFGKAVDKGAAAASKVRGQRAVGDPKEVFGCELAGSDLSNHRHQWCCFKGSTPRGGRGVCHVCALWQYTCLTLLQTVRWRCYRRHVAQLCCWRLATLTGGGVGGWGGMITFLSTVRWPYRRHVAQLCCWRLATLTGRGGGGLGGMITFLSTVRWRYPRHVAQLCCWRLCEIMAI